MQHVNAQIGGKGGGRPDMAMGPQQIFLIAPVSTGVSVHLG